MTTVTLEGTQELMKHRDVAVILATGGMGLVRAAYSAGKPAYGVGPGNAPAYIERTADVEEGRPRHRHRQDVRQRRALLVGELGRRRRGRSPKRSAREFERQGGHFLSESEMERVARVLVTPQRLPNPALVGKSATFIAEKCGITVPPGTRVLIAPLEGVGRDYPLSIEKLCPVLSFYVVQDWREGCERCKQILRYGGMGHTMSIHSQRRAGHPGVRPQEAGLPHRREHADDARIDRADDRARSGDDAGLRRLRRQHHVRQHLSAAPAEHQAAGLRSPARRDARQAARRRCPAEAYQPGRAAATRSTSSQRPAVSGRRARRSGPRVMAATTGSCARRQLAAEAACDPRRAAARRQLHGSERPAEPRSRARRSISSARRTCGWRSSRDGNWSSAARAIITPSARDLAERHRVFAPPV